MIWRNVVTTITHKLVLFIAITVFLWACFLSVMRLTMPLLEEHKDTIVHSLSAVIGVRIQVDRLTTTWRGMQPVVQLFSVKVFDQEGKLKVIIPQINIRINLLKSLWYRRPEIALLQIKNWHINAYQDINEQWVISGFTVAAQTGNNPIRFEDFIAVLSHIYHVQISEGQVEVMADKIPRLSLKHVNLDWYATAPRFSFYGQLTLQQPKATPLKFAAQFKSDTHTFALDNLTGSVYLEMQAFDPALFLNNQAWHWQQGEVTGELWGRWQKNRWLGWTIQLNLHNIQLAQKQKNPWDVKLADGTLDANIDLKDQSTAIFNVSVNNGVINVGHLFRTALAFQSLAISGHWQNQNHQAQLDLTKLQLKTKEVTTQAALSLQWVKNQAPILNLLAHADFNYLASPSKYLPAGIMPKKVVDWLDKSVFNISGMTANMVWRGSVADFPFKNQSGTMSIDGHINNAKLTFAPDWPTINNLVADLEFTSHGMHVVAQSGQFDKLDIRQVIADIPEFSAQSHLIFSSKFATDLTKVWHFLKRAPFAKHWQTILQKTDATGPVNIDLTCNVPLYEGANEPTYQGIVSFDAADKINASVTKLQGVLNFSDAVWSSDHLQADVYGYPWQFQLQRSRASQPVSLTADGLLDLTGVTKAFDVPSMIQLQGVTPLNLQMKIATMVNQPTQWQIQSSLQNARIKLPLGFSKKTDEITPILINGVFNEGGSTLTGLTWHSPQGLVNIERQEQAWNIASPFVSGSVVAPATTDSPWKISLDRLDLSKLSQQMNFGDAQFDSIPAIDFSATKIILNDPDGFSLQLKLRPFNQGTLITQLALQEKTYNLNSQGRMINTVAGYQTQIQGNLNAKKLGKALKSLGLPELLRAEDAIVSFNLSWPGRLWQINRENLQGNVKISTGSGVLTDINSNESSSLSLGRLLNILSISELPKRLSLNFKDFSQKGFQFDKLNGSMKLQPQKINNINVTINGMVADVGLKGCVNIANQKLNLAAEIKPHLTSSLPVIAALAGGPIVGAISFVADKLFSPAVGQLTEINYLIQGDWKNPQTIKTSNFSAAQQLLGCPI